MTTNATTPENAKQKDGLGFRILLKIASAVGIGWQVMLVIVRVIGIIVALIAGPVVGIITLIAFPEAHALIHWAAFLVTPFIVWGLTELFIWYYSSPIDTLIIY